MDSARVPNVDAENKEELEQRTFEEMIDTDHEEPNTKSITAMKVVSGREKGKYGEVFPASFGTSV